MTLRFLAATTFALCVCVGSSTAHAVLAVPQTTSAQCDTLYNDDMAQCYGWICSGEYDYYGCLDACGYGAALIDQLCRDNIDPENNAAVVCEMTDLHAYNSCEEDWPANHQAGEFIKEITGVPTSECSSGWLYNIHKFDPTDDNSMSCYYF